MPLTATSATMETGSKLDASTVVLARVNVTPVGVERSAARAVTLKPVLQTTPTVTAGRFRKTAPLVAPMAIAILAS